MREKPLLLPSAKVAVVYIDSRTPYARYVRYGAIAIGLACVLVGAADLMSRAATTLGSDANMLAFGPAVALDAQRASSTPGVITPARIKIPSIGVDAKVETVGQKDDGTMATPAQYMDVGWYGLGSKPGQTGNAVFAGHVNNALTKAGVFANLSKVKEGDYVTVADAAGRSKVYRVSSIAQYPWDEAPEASIFATTGPSQLVLITCDGDWIHSERTYDKRLVVVAKLAY